MYRVTRTGEKISADNAAIESRCNQLVFFNMGDTPVNVGVRDMPFSFTLAGREEGAPPDYIVFGAMNPAQVETELYTLAFEDTVNTEEVHVMRVYLKEAGPGHPAWI